MFLLCDTVSYAQANQTKVKQDTVPSNYSNSLNNFLKFFTKTSTFELISHNLAVDISLLNI